MTGPAHDLPWLDPGEADPFFENVKAEDVQPPTSGPLFAGVAFPRDPLRELGEDAE